MEGTFRAMNETWRDEAHKRMKTMAEGIAKSMGGNCELTIVRGYPFLINEKKLTEKIRQYATEFFNRKM
jgi:metal-dependent amidase/aminoacylase/carboxypeptidase family protein